MAYELQDPDGDPAYAFDFNLWLASGDSIDTHVWTVTPTGPVITDLGESAGVVSARLSGVLFGQVYRLGCAMTTTLGEKIKRSIDIRGGHR